MSPSASSCPAPRSTVVDLYFMEHRAKLIDIAAFLDRYDRAEDDGAGGDDFRVAALRRAIEILIDGESNRAQRILDAFSDPTSEPIKSAAGMKGADGVYPGAGAGPIPGAGDDA